MYLQEWAMLRGSEQMVLLAAIVGVGIGMVMGWLAVRRAWKRGLLVVLLAVLLFAWGAQHVEDSTGPSFILASGVSVSLAGPLTRRFIEHRRSWAKQERG
jgi:hypothetical protein